MKALDTLLFEASELPTFEVDKESHTSHGEVPSLLKWTGSKRSQAARIASFAPNHDRYFEPFLGGEHFYICLANPALLAETSTLL